MNYLRSTNSVQDGWLLSDIVRNDPPRTCADMAAILRGPADEPEGKRKPRQMIRLFEVLEVKDHTTFDEFCTHVARRKVEPETIERFIRRANHLLKRHGLAWAIRIEFNETQQSIIRHYPPVQNLNVHARG